MTKQEALRIVDKLGFTARKGKELFFVYRHVRHLTEIVLIQDDD